jgi:phenylacetic acid degradation protein PaaD
VTSDAAEALDELARRCADVMWRDDTASRGLGMTLDQVARGTATLSMEIRDDMVNGHGIAHGGFIFAVADSAFAFACNSYNVRTVAQACDIVFTSPARVGDRLVAVATERHRAGRSGIYDIRVSRLTADGEEVVAEFRGRSRTVGGELVPDHNRSS